MRPPIEQEIEAAEVEVADSQRQQTAVMLVSTRLAGNAVIRVVNRCNEAQESNNLGEQCAGYYVFARALEVISQSGVKKRTERDNILQPSSLCYCFIVPLSAVVGHRRSGDRLFHNVMCFQYVV